MAASIGDVFFKVGVNTAQFKEGLNTSVKSLRAWKAQAKRATAGAEQPLAVYMRKLNEFRALLATGKITTETFQHAQQQLRRTYLKNSGATERLAAAQRKVAAETRAAAAAAKTAALSTQRLSVAANVATASLSALKMAIATVLGPLALLFAAVSTTVKAFRTTEDIDRAMHQSLAIMSDVSGEMKAEMRSLANTIAGETVFSTEELSKAFFFLASAGLDAKQSIASLKPVATFAQAGMFDLSRATELLGGSVSALGLSSKDAATQLKNMKRVGDILVAANTAAQATTEEFAQALGTKAAASSRFFNIRAEETVAVLAVLAKNMVKGSEAGTAFDIALRELTNKAILFKDEFKKANVEVFRGGHFVGFANAIGSLDKALEKLDPEEKTALLMKLGFTAKSIANIKIMLGQAAAMREFAAEFDNAGGTMQRVADENLTEFQKGWEATKASFENFAMAFGPLMNIIGQTMLAVSLNVRALFGDFDTLTERLDAAAKAGRLFLKAFAEILKLPGKIPGLSGTTSLGDSISDFVERGEREFKLYKKLREMADGIKAANNEVSEASKIAKDQQVRHAEEVTNAMEKLRKAYEDYGKTASDVNLAIVRASGDPVLIKQAERWVQSLKDQKKAEEGAKTAKKATKDVAKATQRIFDKLKSSAERLRESLRTPQQVFEDEFARYNMFLNKKLLSEEEFIKAVRRARKKMIDPKETTAAARSSVTPALERFSQEAHKIIVGSTTSPEIQNQKKMITELEDSKEVQEDIREALRDRPSVTIAPGVN